MGALLDKYNPHTLGPRQSLIYRSRRALYIRIFLIISFVAFFQQQRLFFIYRTALSAKYSPTDFAEFDPEPGHQYAGGTAFQRELLKNREAWEVLGSGWEGKTFKYNGSVIKTFTPGSSPFRNCGPGKLDARWPTEIPASLYFTEPSEEHEIQDVVRSSNSSVAGLLPVKAYFKAPEKPGATPEWHLVTPLLASGNLDKLSERLKSKQPYRFYREVDSTFRPSFNKLLRTLSKVHEAGFCHDDVKPSNIFLESDTDWKLGDLGNVRHIGHPYHSSRIWQDNQQLPDCRSNDVLRALKSYVQFIRDASYDKKLFDKEFVEGRNPLGSLFWWSFADSPSLSAAGLEVRSQVEGPERPSQPYSSLNVQYPTHSIKTLALFSSREVGPSTDVDEILQMSGSEKIAQWAALTKIFGIPVAPC